MPKVARKAFNIGEVWKLQKTFCFFKTLATYGFIKALWCLSTTRQATRYMYLKTMLKILVERAVMYHISFLSEWHLLWRSIEILVLCFVTITSAKNLFPDFAPYAIFQIDILIFGGGKGTEREKNTDVVLSRCHGKANLNLVYSAPYQLVLRKQ